MGNYRQHLAFASSLGVGYSAAAYFLAGLHWLYGTVAILLATLGGLLPDLDSPSGVELKGFTGILGVLGALAVWQEVGQVHPPPVFEIHLWAVVVTFVLIRHGLRRMMGTLTVHRGISHSFPTMAVWTELTYLHYPSSSHLVRLMMGAAVGVGFFSHLLLDEICSVDLKGARLNKAFGTAMKFWAPSVWSTLAIYGALSVLTYQVIQQWPDDPLENGVQIRMPSWPSGWPRPNWLSSAGRLPTSGAVRDRPDSNTRDDKTRRGSTGDGDWISGFQDLPLSQEHSRTAPQPGRRKRVGD
jgi:hypothetical protein